MEYLLIVLICAGVGLIALGLLEGQHEATEAAINTRLTRVKQGYQPPKEITDAQRDFARREEKRARATRKTTFLPSASALVSSNAILGRLEEDLIQVKSRWRASELLAFSVLLALAVFSAVNYFTSWLLAVPLAIFCLFLPWLYLKILRAAYYRAFDEQLADTLTLMANSLKAGFSFLQSLEMVGREAQPPISDEFTRMTQEIAVGVPVQNALENMSVRINSVDLQLMVMAVLIQREIGGSLAEILENIAGVIRERMSIKREIRTLTAQGRLTGAIIGLLPVGLGIALHLLTKAMQPGEPSFIMPLLTDPVGQVMLGVAVVMQIIGFYLIQKIVTIKI